MPENTTGVTDSTFSATWWVWEGEGIRVVVVSVCDTYRVTGPNVFVDTGLTPTDGVDP